MDIFRGREFQQVTRKETRMVKKKLGGGEIVGVEIRRGFWKLLQGLEHLINVLWFTFLKDYYGCYTEKRLQEDKGLKLGDKLGGYWKDPDENGSGLDEDVSGEDEKYLDSGCILKMGPTELGNRLNVGMRERGESKKTKVLIWATGRMGLSYIVMEKNETGTGLQNEI